MAKYVKGESGNLAGRPKGIVDKRAALRSLLDPHAGALIEKVVSLALEGDTAALRLCLERLVPPAKDAAITIPNLQGTLTDKAQCIIEGMARADYAPSVAVDLLRAVAAQARVFELDELERRVTRLEKDVEQI